MTIHALTVGELKAQFSQLLLRVQKGEDIAVLYGRAKKPVAVLTQYKKNQVNGVSKRKIGTFNNKGVFSEIENGKITMEEFLGL